MLRSILVLIFTLGLGTSLVAQNLGCEQTLALASSEFEAGRFYSISSILKPCLEGGFSKEQRVRAYLLLTQAYLVLDDPIAAENSYLALLKADPEYLANPSRDPIDVYYLSKKFTTTPIFTPHFRLGANTSLARAIYELSTDNKSSELDNAYKLGYQVGAGLDWNIDSHWSLCLGLGYSFKSFKATYSNIFGADTRTFTEKQDWFDIPLYIRYSTDSGKIRPFGYVGVAANLLTGARLSLEGIDGNISGSGQTPSTGPDEPITFKRNFFNQSLVFGGGIKVKQGINYFYVDVRYLAGLNNVVDIRKNYYDQYGNYDPLITKYGYLSDFFRLDNLSISIGFIKPLYNPRKKKKAVTDLFEKLGLRKNKNAK
jgi:hypothetical protein